MSQSKTASSVLQQKLRRRENLYQTVRAYFKLHDVTEVYSPVISPYACPDPNIEPLTVTLNVAGINNRLYLHTSPEFAMKKLISAGCGSIYQIAPVFRDCDLGRYHQPEFTMLEWYRVGFTYFELIDEVETLLDHCLAPFKKLESTQRLSYRESFEQTIKLNPLTASVGDCQACCQALNIHYPDGMDGVDEWLDLLMTHVVAPTFPSDRLTVIYDYPASQAALATLRDSEVDNATIAERFEVYIGPIELANGFNELIDGDVQQQRFEQENLMRRENGQASVNIDFELIDSLNTTMPECSGVALGLDRLLMVMHNVEHINDVVLFPITK